MSMILQDTLVVFGSESAESFVVDTILLNLGRLCRTMFDNLFALIRNRGITKFGVIPMRIIHRL